SVAKTPKNVLNKKEAIILAANKLDSMLKLQADNILVPKSLLLSQLSELTIKEVINKGLRYPVLARTPHHSKGRDILLCLQNKDLVRAVRWGKTFLVEYISTDREYRVHVFKDEIIRVSQKILMSRDDYLPYMRNVDHNHSFGNPKKQLTAEQKAIAIKAVKSLGLDFGAVDLIVGDDGGTYVLEINTGPSLIEIGVDIYKKKVQEIIQGIQAHATA
ncbi:MAG TPA: hypothetical protein VI146_08510, partial [Nitrososphaeraceae archaeon]